MKKQFLIILSIFMLSDVQSAPGPQLAGAMVSGGIHNTGTIILYTGGDTSLNTIINLPNYEHSFGVGGPYSLTLTEAPNGKLYGLNANDSTYGTIYEFDYNTLTYTVVVAFDSVSGAYPFGALTLASNGLLYGLTSQDGANFGGTLFSYSPGGNSITRLADLPANAGPYGSLIQASDGNLYGLTQNDGTNGGGTIFQYLISSGTYNVLYNLPQYAWPQGALLEVGNDTLFGLTDGDGTNQGGTLFSYVIGAVSDSVLINLSSLANPEGSLIRATNGKLYGVTNDDGANSAGTIFSYDIGSNAYTDLWDFGSGTDGTLPSGDLYQASDGKLYGTTPSGGINGFGSIFQYDIGTTTYTQDFSFDSLTGYRPQFGHLSEVAPPAIVQQPLAQTVCDGSSLTISTSVNGVYTSLQWQVSNNGGSSFDTIPGATNTTYSFTAESSENGNLYRVIFTNINLSDTTNAVAITVIASLNDTATVNDAVCTASQGGASYQWLNCSNSQLINGANSQTFTATQTGSYSCIVTAGNCTDTTNCVAVTTLGVSTIPANSFNLYPNPTNGSIYIASTLSRYAVEIYDMTGRSIYAGYAETSNYSFNLDSTAKGVYFYRITSSNGSVQTDKIVLY